MRGWLGVKLRYQKGKDLKVVYLSSRTSETRTKKGNRITTSWSSYKIYKYKMESKDLLWRKFSICIRQNE